MRLLPLISALGAVLVLFLLLVQGQGSQPNANGSQLRPQSATASVSQDVVLEETYSSREASLPEKVKEPEQKESADEASTQRIEDLELRIAALEQELRLCRSFSADLSVATFLQMEEAMTFGPETRSWLELVSEYYPIPMSRVEILALAENQALIDSDNWNRGVIDLFGLQRVRNSMASWSDAQVEKLLDNLYEEEQILLTGYVQ